jgi:hypothetical protein
MIETVFERLLGNSYRTHFDYWHQRLEEELGQPEAGQAAVILTRISRSTAGETLETLTQAMSTVLQDPLIRDQALHYLLDVLRSDGYLVEREARYAFRLEWLRVYWQRRFAA